MTLMSFTRSSPEEGWTATRIGDPSLGIHATVASTLEPDRELITLVTSDQRSMSHRALADSVARALRSHAADHDRACTIPPPEGPLFAGGHEATSWTGETTRYFFGGLPGDEDRLSAQLWQEWRGANLELRFVFDAADAEALAMAEQMVTATSEELFDGRAR